MLSANGNRTLGIISFILLGVTVHVRTINVQQRRHTFLHFSLQLGLIKGLILQGGQLWKISP